VYPIIGSQPQNALLEYTSDAAGDGGSGAYHDCAAAATAATDDNDDDDDTAITRLTRLHIRVFGTTEWL
jgi:hypothetical protein